MRYSTRNPKHLPTRMSRESVPVLGQLLLIAVTVLIGGLLVMIVTRHGTPTASETPLASETTTRPTSSPPTAGTPATAPAPDTSASGAPGSGTPAVGGDNLLANPGFEVGLDGWSPIDGAKLDLAGVSREGSLALSLAAGSGRSPGVSARHATRTEARRSYSASAWVRANRAGVVAELNLVEYVGDRRLSVDTSGAVLPDTSWQRLDVTHVTHRPGSELAIEVVLPNLARNLTVALDSLRLRRDGPTEAFVPETTAR
jgi:hypothetical protein